MLSNEFILSACIYCGVPLLTYMVSLATTFNFNFLLLVVKKKKKRQESEYKMRARLDKRIERARARHELACLVMGTIFLLI